MEPQVEIYCKKDKRKDCSCIWLILAIVLFVLAFFLGVLISALTAIITTLGLGAIITLVVVFAVLALLTIVFAICCRESRNNKNYCF